MPSARLPEWFLCVDAGGTAVKCVIRSSTGLTSSALGGPCNVKSVGPRQAMRTILRATQDALSRLPLLDFPFNPDSVDDEPPPLPARFFSRVWLGLAGVLYPSDVTEFAPLARDAFGFEEGEDALKITNDGHLLAAPCLTMPHLDSTIATVAGTGSCNLAFRRHGSELDFIGQSGGWGFLLGDEGSAFAVSRIAMTRLLSDYDSRTTAALRNPHASPSAPLSLFSDLLHHFDVPDAATLIDKTYRDHSDGVGGFLAGESNRKLWIARGARVVFRYAFEEVDAKDGASREIALAIVREAVAPLVSSILQLVVDRGVVNPSRALLSLGGGMWKAEGYRNLLLCGLKERGVEFAEVKVVESAAEEGAKALCAQAQN
ncbi:glucokinase regulator family protein [Rhodotorula toruloides]|uniref:N-acetyl-D-glucosamine kinase n=1 Tax=Rhodotorula toruloides TaxID=5286 RepID=A0A511KPJ0_RHOTO|nr:glucokinase regulator family protein [Rhodotorula toruloides]